MKTVVTISFLTLALAHFTNFANFTNFAFASYNYNINAGKKLILQEQSTSFDDKDSALKRGQEMAQMVTLSNDGIKRMISQKCDLKTSEFSSNAKISDVFMKIDERYSASGTEKYRAEVEYKIECPSDPFYFNEDI